MPVQVQIQAPPPLVAATLRLPPVDPYIAAAGYNMLVEVTFQRIARYVDDVWQPEQLLVSVNAPAVMAAARAASGTTFESPWLRAVQGGAYSSSAQVAIQCRLTVGRIGAGGEGQVAIGVLASFSAYSVSIEGLGNWVKIDQTLLGEFGPLLFQVLAPLSATPDAAHALATVAADLAGATISVDQASSPDALWLAGTGVGQGIVAAATQAIRARGTIDLMPPLSPFGPVGGANVFEVFQVDAFPTANPPNAAAGLSVGFRLRAASAVSPAEVQSIAGFDHYGTILDAWTVARVVEWRWAHGAFVQDLTYAGTTTVDLGDGSGPQDVEMWGAVQLATLDGVAIVVDHALDRELDYLELSGKCQVTVDKVKTLKDGKEQSLTKDNSFPSGWSFAAGASPSPPPPTAPVSASEQAFVDQASRGAIQYLARPLRGVTQTVVSAALDGVAGFLYATGRF
jgi:hypothetical protein